MLTTQEDLLKVLDELNIRYTNHEHPAVFTVEQADQHKDGIDGVHSKNLFLKDKKKQLFLVTTLAHKPVKIKEVAKKIGAKSPSFAKPDLLQETLGVMPGSVTPFAAVNDTDNRVKVVLDEEMMENDLLNFHPLVNTGTTTISSKDFLRFLEKNHPEFEIIRL